MQNPAQSNIGAAALGAGTAAIFGQAAAAGREVLDNAELATLISGLALEFKEVPSTPAQSDAVEVRISLNNTREFGMVLSAGLGGLDAELDESNFRKDRASVYAAAELTDADDFLGLFKRTLSYQKLVGRAKREGLPPADAQLRACFERLLVLAVATRQAIPRQRSCCAAWSSIRCRSAKAW